MNDVELEDALSEEEASAVAGKHKDRYIHYRVRCETCFTVHNKS
jgi:hypothetical protein